MKKVYILLLSLFVVLPYLHSQEVIKIMEYNVENLFDTQDDPLTNDKEYLPGGYRGWNYTRYKHKLNNIAKVIVSAGEWNPPALIGLCEIENRNVLEGLVQYTGLRNLNYRIAHYESPDFRGIDVALLYLPDKFKLIESRPLRVVLPDTNMTTRDILYVSGRLNNGDTLHVFVNHFPSRWGGETVSEEKRHAAARVLRYAIDSISTIIDNPKVVIIGDFNDMPDNSSILHVLNAKPYPKDTSEILPNELYNLTYKFHEKGDQGSYRYKQEWNMLDQVIVTGVLLDGSKKTRALESTMRIYSPDWLLEEDKITGLRPFRTYIGMKYHGGYSDHLPVLINIALE